MAAAGGVLALSAAVVAYQQSGGGGPPEPPAGGRGPGGQGGAGGRGNPRGEGISVGFLMKGMNRALRQLKEQAGDATKREENLRLINEMQRGCVLSKGEPVSRELLNQMKDEAGKAKLREEYRTHLHGLLRVLVDAESAMLEGKPEVAKAKLEEAQRLRDAGHKAMGVSDD